MKIKLNLLLAVLFLTTSIINGQTKLPTFFSDGMVLQQKENVAIWGNDEPNNEVTVIASWGETSSAITDKNGKWKLKITTPTAGGPYDVSIKGSEEKKISDVLIGEVWFCSGQSNMAYKVKHFSDKDETGSNETILNSKNNNIRFFQTKRELSVTELDDVSGEWKASESSTVPEFSAVAYFFAKTVNKQLNIPIGIIESDWGGTPVEGWMSKEILEGFKDIDPVSYLPKIKHKQPNLLYNAMVHPFLTYNIKGVLWYQGETNHIWPDIHNKLFPAMINSWRKDWEVGNFPFYYVQLAPFQYDDPKASVLPYFWESQLKTMQQTENTGMVVTLDVGNCTDIHPKEKREVGNRLAYWALAKTYGVNGISYSGPIYKDMEVIEDSLVKINFDQTDLTGFRNELTGFEIAGKDKVFYPATAEIFKGQYVTLKSDKVKNPVAVRYAFENCSKATLFNTYGLPASSFRTDDWD